MFFSQEYRRVLEDAKRSRDAFTTGATGREAKGRPPASGSSGFAVLDESGNLRVTSADGSVSTTFRQGDKM